MVGISEMINDTAKISEPGECVSENFTLPENISNLVESCMVPGLSKPYDEYTEPLNDYYSLFSQEKENKLLELNSMLNGIEPINFKQPTNDDFVTTMFLLTEEMKTEGPWYDECYSKHSYTIIHWFQNKCNFCDPQDNFSKKYKSRIFQNCMRKIHSKLTKDKWKYHPAAFHCYRNIINNLHKMGKMLCPLPLVFPGTLLQLDDYHDENKVEGLKCCSSLLRNLEYSETGYEEVVYETLLKLLNCREASVLEGTLECIMLILPMFSTQTCNSRWSKSDDVYEIILGDLYLETELTRKKVYLKYLPNLFDISGNSAIRWKKKIVHLLCDTIDIYLNDHVEIHIVDHCLKCLRAWLTISWPVWNSITDSEILIRLYKLVYALSDVAETEDVKHSLVSVEKCIVFIFSLCTEEQRQKLLDDENVEILKLGENFCKHWNIIKNKIINLTHCTLEIEKE